MKLVILLFVVLSSSGCATMAAFLGGMGDGMSSAPAYQPPTNCTTYVTGTIAQTYCQ